MLIQFYSKEPLEPRRQGPPSQILEDMLTLFQTGGRGEGGADYAYQIRTPPPGLSDLPMAKEAHALMTSSVPLMSNCN
jgi:hypothetical protein